MKKRICLVLLLLLVALALIGCSEHILTTREGLEPTCAADGYSSYKKCICFWCDYKEDFEILPAKEHSFEAVEAKLATPYENGHTAYEECSVCHFTRGYEATFYAYPVCERLPDAKDRPFVRDLPAAERSELAHIYNALMRFDEDYTLTQELTISDVERLMEYLNLIFPELIHCANGYSYLYSEDIVSRITFEYTMDRQEYADAMEAINERVSAVLAATQDLSEPQREIYVHDYIINTCDYEIDANHSGDAYGALVLGKAKCDGYAKAFSLLMMSMGAECYTVSGSTDEGPHAWNVVLVDGEYYNVDVTWDDEEAKGAMYAYFNISDEIFDKTHLTDEYYEALVPKCNSILLSVPYIDGTHIKADEDVAIRLSRIAAIESRKEEIDVHIRVDTAEQLEYLEENINKFFEAYLGGRNQRFRFSTYTYKDAGYMRFVVDVIDE